MPNVMITQTGLDFIKNAHDVGPIIWLKWFVPVYDDRIDPTVRTSSTEGVTLSSFSQVANDGFLRTLPYGEIIWSNSGFSLEGAGHYLISANDFSDPLMQNSYQKTLVATNLYNGQTLSNQISANIWNAVTSANALYNWSGPGGIPVTAISQTSAFWRSGDYYPVFDTSAESKLRGNVKCIINNNNGNFKFNKIALYASQSANSDIAFFGEAYLSNPTVVSDLEIGFSQFEFDVQIDLSGVDATWDNIFYSSSADYWSHSPGGLYFPNRIGVGQFDGNTYEISATMQLRYARGDRDNGIPLLRLDYDNDKYTTIDQKNSSTKVVIGNGGDISIGVGKWTSYCGDAISVIPNISQTLTLGNQFNRWREIWLGNYSDVDVDPNANACLNIFNQLSASIVIADNVNPDLSLNTYQVIIGRPAGNGNELRAVRINDLRIEIDPPRSFTSDENNDGNLYGVFKGGDLWREGQNLLIYNSYCTNDLNYGVEKIYMFAGLNLLADYTSVEGQTGPTHKNIVYAIENETSDSGKRLFCGVNTNLANTSEIHIAAKGKIGLHGPIELQNLSEYASLPEYYANAIVISRSLEKRLLIGSGIRDSVNFNTLTDRMKDKLYFRDLVETDSTLFLIASQIYVDSDIYPMRDNIVTLGNANNGGNRFAQVATNLLFAGNSNSVIPSGLKIGDITGEGDNNVNIGIIKLGNSIGDTIAQIGQADDPIDYGFFNQIGKDGKPVNQIYVDYIGNGENASQQINTNRIFANNYYFAADDSILGQWSDLSFTINTSYNMTATIPVVSYTIINNMVFLIMDFTFNITAATSPLSFATRPFVTFNTNALSNTIFQKLNYHGTVIRQASTDSKVAHIKCSGGSLGQITVYFVPYVEPLGTSTYPADTSGEWICHIETFMSKI